MSPSAPGGTREEEGGGEPPGDFSRQGRPAPRRKPVRWSPAGRPAPAGSRLAAHRSGMTPLAPRVSGCSRKLADLPWAPPGPGGRSPPARARPRGRSAPASPGKVRRLHSTGLQAADDLSRTIQAARSRSLEHGPGHPVGPVRCQPADRGAGADGEDERHHRVGGLAGDRDVPARQPRRQRLLGLHERLVLRGAEAFAGADGIPASLPPRPGADRGRAARGALRVRPGARSRP